MAKINDSIVLRIVITLGSLAFVAASFYVLTNYRLDAVETDIVKSEDEIEEIDARVDMVEDIVSIIQNDLNYIRGDIAEQKALSKQILIEVMK